MSTSMKRGLAGKAGPENQKADLQRSNRSNNALILALSSTSYLSSYSYFSTSYYWRF